MAHIGASIGDCYGVLWRNLPTVLVIVGCVIAGGAVGLAARWWVNGLNGQRAQLHQCVLASQRSHPNENAESMLAHLNANVPDCMDPVGYAAALDNKDCGRELWQGNVYCYVPKNYVGSMLYKIETLL
jgi:hypothetical protein